jgi:outer membrane beta-barrel protein
VIAEAEKTMGSTMKRTATLSKLLCAAAAMLGVVAATETASAQEILLTGPLAGAPAVRKLRLYREHRFEIAPAASFTLLDEYQRTILFGARLNYNITDWLAIGAFGAFGAVKVTTGLTDKVQAVSESRHCRDANGNVASNSTDCRLTAVNLGPDLKKQLGSMDWVLAPQITAVPFRGKLALFQSIYVDTDLYFFAGPAFVGVSERKDCAPGPNGDCTTGASFDRQSRVAVTGTFGLGLTFYVNKWNAIGFEWRALPFAWNTGGFDTGGGQGGFPDNKINGDDRPFHFNQMLTVSYNFYLPMEHRVSE